MKKLIAIASVTSLLMLAGCARTVPVSFQGPAKLSPELKTYAVLVHPVGTTLSTNDIFMRGVHEAMTSKGYVAAPHAEADVLVSFKALMGSKNDDQASNQAGPTVGVGTTSSGGDIRKVVMVLLEEARTDQIMWVGWSSVEVPDHQAVMRARESIQRILDGIPPRG